MCGMDVFVVFYGLGVGFGSFCLLSIIFVIIGSIGIIGLMFFVFYCFKVFKLLWIFIYVV